MSVMTGFSTIAIIYNPNATGNGQRLGQELIDALRVRLPSQRLELLATEHVGHAEEIAYGVATTYKRPLIIAASGDGGYHEVVNGALRAQAEGASPTTGLLPAGNANDHFRNVRGEHDIVTAICGNHSRQIDVLKLSATIAGEQRVRYAHSYIGFGLTAQVGYKLANIKGKRWKEMLAVTNTVLAHKPMEFMRAGKRSRAHSIIISNVPTMGKYFSVGRNSKSDDGRFELAVFATENQLRLAAAVVKRMTIGVRTAQQTGSFDFETLEPMLAQLDGEVITIDSGSEVTIEIAPKILRCIV